MSHQEDTYDNDVLTEQECRLLSLYRSAGERDREGIVSLIEYMVETENNQF